ncbi:hypothetical protein [Granulicella sp. S190]|uniref:hypothetical protein n=1 Tax=Granulicella sp. S190 TaxID=1747226 RepID=UPI00131E1C8F|nr:hypothetical protein [Granulicella sp. S190]
MFLGSAIALTLVFYMAAYYLLPPPPPSGAMVALFAAVALAIVWGVGALLNRRQSSSEKKGSPPTVRSIFLWAVLGFVVALSGCNAAPPTAAPAPAPAPPPSPPPPPPAPLPPPAPAPAPPPTALPVPSADPDEPASTAPAPLPPGQSAGMDAATSRVTGTAILLPQEKEAVGYGLYSYALLSHPPEAGEVAQYTAFLKALVDLPTAEGLARYVPKSRINITSILLTAPDPGWDGTDADAKVAFILAHYDYARSAAIRSSLSSKTGAGPVLVSVLHPIDPAMHPHPVLVQDMSLAQPSLMSAYVQAFVSQVAHDRFWQESALSQFALGLRNSLEVAATGLNLSKAAVDGWVKFFK